LEWHGLGGDLAAAFEVCEPLVAVGSQAQGLNSTCVYYNIRGSEAGQWQFCFDRGKLSSKNRS